MLLELTEQEAQDAAMALRVYAELVAKETVSLFFDSEAARADRLRALATRIEGRRNQGAPSNGST